MKDKAIYYMDGQTTVCLLQENGVVIARGISVCSRWDCFDGAEGRRLARNRALEARGRQEDCALINPDVIHRNVYLSLARDRFGDYKGYYYPNLTNTECLVLRLKG